MAKAIPTTYAWTSPDGHHLTITVAPAEVRWRTRDVLRGLLDPAEPVFLPRNTVRSDELIDGRYVLNAGPDMSFYRHSGDREWDWAAEQITRGAEPGRPHVLVPPGKRSSDARSSDARSADARSADARSADARSADARSADARSADIRSADIRSAGGGKTTSKWPWNFLDIYDLAPGGVAWTPWEAEHPFAARAAAITRDARAWLDETHPAWRAESGRLGIEAEIASQRDDIARFQEVTRTARTDLAEARRRLTALRTLDAA